MGHVYTTNGAASWLRHGSMTNSSYTTASESD
jgi:hypothetical protein